MSNCTVDGKLHPIDDTKFSQPVPLVGLYIASATLLCAIAMLADLIHGIRSKQYWIPSRYFSLNAASITIVGVAIKLSVDLTTPMPEQLGQLAKLGTSAFLFNVLLTFAPSVPKLGGNEFLANLVGLTIVVMTSVVNVCIQLKTGVIYLFEDLHIYYLCLIIIGIINIISYGTFRTDDTQSRYKTQHQIAMSELLGDRQRENVPTEKLKEYLTIFTLMAHSGCPHFVVTRSTYDCLLLWVAVWSSTYNFLSFISEGKHSGLISCSGESDYEWSVQWIFITQIIAMVVALVISSFRLVYICVAHFKASRLKDIESPERQHFWMHNLEDLQTNAFNSYINYKHPMFIVLMKYSWLLLVLGLRFPDIVFLLLFIALWKGLLYLIPSVSRNSGPNNHTASISHVDQNFIKLRPYVLYRKGEERLIRMLIKSASYVTHKYITAGQRREPKHLLELLNNYMSCDFGGVVSFDSVAVPSLNPQGSPPNCWTLPVVTLTRIAIALPDVDRASIDKLIKSVKESILYVNMIENDFSSKHDLGNIKAAASVAWAGVDLRHRWLGVDLTRLALRNRSPLMIIESLSHRAEEKFSKMMTSNPPKAIAAHSMYRICQTLLREYQNEDNRDRLSERIFEKVRSTISDILGACLTNLKRWMILECSKSSPEKRRDAAYRILKFFGETEKIMKIVEQREIPNLSLDQMGFIDEWHAFPHSP